MVGDREWYRAGGVCEHLFQNVTLLLCCTKFKPKRFRRIVILNTPAFPDCVKMILFPKSPVSQPLLLSKRERRLGSDLCLHPNAFNLRHKLDSMSTLHPPSKHGNGFWYVFQENDCAKHQNTLCHLLTLSCTVHITDIVYLKQHRLDYVTAI